jgi:hypothetical protein
MPTFLASLCITADCKRTAFVVHGDSKWVMSKNIEIHMHNLRTGMIVGLSICLPCAVYAQDEGLRLLHSKAEIIDELEATLPQW